MQLQTLLTALEQKPLHIQQAESLNLNSDITGIAYDSRKVVEHGLFVAVPGTHTDGRRYLGEAVKRGATAALGEALPTDLLQPIPLPYIEVEDVRSALADLACAIYDYPAQKLCTIGVTGTDG